MANPRLPLSGLSRRLRLIQTRQSSSQTIPPTRPHHDPYALLSTPTWSVRALLPPTQPTTTTATPQTPSSTTSTTTQSQPKEDKEEITPQTLSHLLRLSALPQPTTETETHHMLQTLHAQLHFVRDIQRVNTDGIPPLSSIRDETPEGLREATITVSTLQQALAEEEVVGRCKRPRRRRGRTQAQAGGGEGPIKGVEDWDVLGCAQEKVGRYFIVRSAGNGVVEGNGEGAAVGVKDGE